MYYLYAMKLCDTMTFFLCENESPFEDASSGAGFIVDNKGFHQRRIELAEEPANLQCILTRCHISSPRRRINGTIRRHTIITLSTYIRSKTTHSDFIRAPFQISCSMPSPSVPKGFLCAACDLLYPACSIYSTSITAFCSTNH